MVLSVQVAIALGFLFLALRSDALSSHAHADSRMHSHCFTHFFIFTETVNVQLKAPNSGDDVEGMMTKGVQYRLVPDTRDLMGARMLLTMDPADGEKLKAGGDFNAEDAQKAIQKAMTDSPKFKETYNEIPVFMIQVCRLFFHDDRSCSFISC